MTLVSMYKQAEKTQNDCVEHLNITIDFKD